MSVKMTTRESLLELLEADAEAKSQTFEIYDQGNRVDEQMFAYELGANSRNELLVIAFEALESLSEHKCGGMCGEVYPNHFETDQEGQYRRTAKLTLEKLRSALQRDGK